MRLGRLARYGIPLVPLVVCAARIHAARSGAPQGMTQEINRCLTLVRATASRRRQEHDRKLEQQLSSATEGPLAQPKPAPQADPDSKDHSSARVA